MRKAVKTKFPGARAGVWSTVVWLLALSGLCAILSGCILTEDSKYVRYPNGGAPSYFGVKPTNDVISKDESVARMRQYEQGVMDTTGQSDYISRNPRPAVPPTSPVLADGKTPQEMQDKWKKQWWTKDDGASKILASRASYGSTDQIEDRLPEYVIRTGDSISISIAMEPTSQMTVPVRPDGRITYLYGIEVIAAGKTYHQLHDVLVTELSKYYRNPRVTVVGNSFSGNDVFVMGATSRSGRYTIDEQTRLLDILAQAGVMSMYFNNTGSMSTSSVNDSFENASRAINTPDLDASYIARDGKILPVDLKKLLMYRDLSQNIYLRPHDFIFVPSIYAQGGKKIYCTGAIEEGVIDFNGKLTLRELLLKQEMDKESARMKGIYIVRKGIPDPIRINAWAMLQGREPDIELQDNDIVYVPERTLSRRSDDIKNVIDEVVSPLNSLLELHDTAKKYYNKEWNIKDKTGDKD